MKDATDPKQIEKSLYESEARYHALVESLDITFCRWQPDTTLLFTNAKYRELFAAQGDPTGKKWLALLPESSRASVAEFCQELVQNPRIETYERPVTIKDGSKRDYQWVDSPIFDNQGNLIEFQSVGIDITERKRAEQAVKDSEELHRLILTSISDAVFMTDKEGLFTYVCPSVQTIFGYSEAEVMHLGNIDKLLGEGFFETEQLAQQGELTNIELTIFDKTDIAHHLLVNIKQVTIGNSSILYTCRDISERKHAEQQLQSSEENLRTFFDSMDDMAFIVDLKGKVLHTNPAVTDKLGYSPEEAKGMNVLDFHPSTERSEAEQIFIDMLAKQRSSCPLPLAHKNGALVPVETRIWFGKWDLKPCIFGLSKDLSLEQEALQKFDKLFHNNPVPMAVSLIPERTFTEINDAFVQVLGYAREEIIGNTFEQLKLFVDLEQHQLVGKELLDTGRIRNCELQIRTKSGQILDGLFFGERIKSQGKQYFLTLMVDMTGEKQLNQALLATNARYASILRAASDGFCRIDMQGNLLEVNAAYCRMSGYSEIELLTMNIVDLDTMQTPTDVHTMIQKIIAKGEGRFETCHCCKNDDVIDLEVSVQYKAEEGGYLVAFLKDISERKQAEKALRESNGRNASILRAALDGFLRTDIKGNLLEANATYCHMSGYSEAELLTMNVADFEAVMTPADVAAVSRRLMAEGEAQFESRHRRKDGSLFDVEVSIQYKPYQDGDQNGGYTVAFIKDISERKQAEQALHESYERNASILRAASDGYWRTDMQGHVLDVNAAYCRMSGYSEAELLTMSIADIEATMAPAEIATNLQHLTIENEARFETQHRRKDGSLFDLDVSVQYKPDEGGYSVAFLKDISERKRSEKALRESSERYASILRAALDGFWRTDMQGNLLEVNATYCRMSGYSEAELLTMGVHDIEALQTPDEIVATVQKAIEEGGSRFESQHRRKDGTLFDVEANIQYKPDGDGYVVAFFKDISERKRAENALQESSERYASILRAALDGFWRTDMQGNLLEVNAAYCRMSGYSEAELLTMNVRDVEALHTPDDVTATFQKVTVEGGIRFETRHRRKDGSMFDLDISGQYKPGKNGYTIAFMKDISERKRAEQALKASEQRFHSYVEQAADAIFVHNDLGQFTAVNQQACRGLGYSREELMGMGVIDVDMEVDFAQAQILWRELIPDQPITLTGTHLRKDGSTFPAEVRIGCFELEGERHYLAVVRDITERVQTEKNLRASENRYRTILKTMPDFLFEIAQDGTFLDYSATEHSSLYTSPQDFIGQNVLNVLPHSTSSMVLTKITECLNHKELVKFDYALDTLAGRKYVENRIVPLTEQSVLSVVRDMTDTKEAEQRIQQQLQRISALNEIERAIASSMDMHISLNILLRETCTQLGVDAASILLFNEKKNTLEYFAEQGFRGSAIRDTCVLLGQGMAGQVGAEQKIRYVPNISAETSRCTRQILLISEEIVTYFGAPLIVKGLLKGVLELFHRAPIEFSAESFHYLETLAGQAAIAIDNATLFKNLQTANLELERRVEARTEELQRANLELEQANRAKSDFLANMSHELRSPLNSILGLSESMQEGVVGFLTERQVRYLKIIESSGSHLLELINDILDLSKIEAGKLELQTEIVCADTICQASMLFVKEPALKKKIRLSFLAEPKSFELLGDPRRLKQILINLLSNAVKFTPNSGEVKLIARAEPKREVVTFTVEDNGIGIAPEHINHLFTPFTQLDSGLNRQYEGTGLGLSLVRKLTELHGGGVTVESKVGQGCHFIVTLPWQQRKEIEESDHGAGMQTSLALDTSVPKRHGRILVGEDNPFNAEVVQDYLMSKGYEVVVAHHGGEVLLVAETFHPDLILMDIQMPVMDGLEATQKIRAIANFRETPIIALTALAMPGDRERCLQAGVDEYLSKPVKLGELFKLIDRLLTRNLHGSGGK